MTSLVDTGAVSYLAVVYAASDSCVRNPITIFTDYSSTQRPLWWPNLVLQFLAAGYVTQQSANHKAAG